MLILREQRDCKDNFKELALDKEWTGFADKDGDDSCGYDKAEREKPKHPSGGSIDDVQDFLWKGSKKSKVDTVLVIHGIM